MAEEKINLKDFLYHKVLNVLNAYDYDDIYTIIFFVYSNECFEYENYQNLSEFSVSNNTEQYYKREYEDYMKNIEAKMIIWIHVKMGVLVKLDGIMHI